MATRPVEPPAPEGGDDPAGRGGRDGVLDELVRRPHGERIGLIKWFSDRLGYGFVTVVEGPDKGTDLFVHYTSIHPLNNLHRTLRKGEYVSFDVGVSNGGPQAVQVTGVMGGPLLCDSDDSHAFSAGPAPGRQRLAHVAGSSVR